VFLTEQGKTTARYDWFGAHPLLTRRNAPLQAVNRNQTVNLSAHLQRKNKKPAKASETH
jgi:hypothetical protein